jgi:RNA polymerase sigma-70 factor (ECF subfamily)
MGDDAAQRTSSTLLGRLSQGVTDQAAWNDFVGRYGPLIFQWCRRWNLQEPDAQDVTQTVLLRLADKMRAFRYDPARSFRAYLKTLTHYAWCDFVEGRQRPGAGRGGSEVRELLETLEARDDLAGRLEAEFDRELLDEAMARVRLRVQPHTWEAFRLTALDGLSGAETAARLGLEVATVFKAKSKVQKMLQDEVSRLDTAGPP